MKRIIIITTFILCVISVNPGYSYWLWSPKTGKWVNPKTSVKQAPKDQLAFAKNLFEMKKYEEAKREFKKLLKSYPKSVEAAESQFYLGSIDQAQGKLYEAYKDFQKIIDKYPFSERIQEVIEREYNIAEAFMGGQKNKGLGAALQSENPAIEIFSKVITNSMYGPLAPKAQYKLGLVLKGLGRFDEAEDAFNKVISNYPASEWVEASKFQIASCRQAVSRGSDYDQAATKEAKEKFEAFLREHPDAVLANDAEKNIGQLREKEAESSYTIALFYEKQKDYKSAKIYLENIVNNYPESALAAKALEKLQVLERKK